ncbi:AraC family transcriptional regulator [Porphyrobacter sp. ULC335]|uniref:AraC family transcriptional regulator n=1 Tax=Porphyrobacter sp. ULC335 TaxID=2854260 RepID=UPI00221F85AE|nr:AraC family transcriptional regulator [Porphyrobacter sp. ULC335]UYV15568.1 AraC family transcriptional regulator [Porphyrobacter sp. ULC335]
MNEAAAENYRKRMARVLDHIDRHPDGDLRLEALAGVAAFSKFHFHRQFAASFGISVQAYVNLSRLKRAAFQLGCRTEMTVIAVALEAGYQTPDSFARSFRKAFGVSPSAFRKNPDWSAWHAAILPQTQARKHAMTLYTSDQVDIVDVAATPVLTLRHDGPPHMLSASIGRFIAWRKANGAGPQRTRTFTIFHADGEGEPQVELACSRLPGLALEEGMGEATIPAGRCARLQLIGPGDDLKDPANWLYREWLPASGEALRDFPLFCERSNFGPGIPEGEMVTDLYLPLA